MNYGLRILFLIIGFLPACFNSNQLQSMQNLIIQAPIDVALITKIQQKLSPAIMDIITQEAAVPWDEKWAFFFFKKRAAITIYYANEVQTDGQAYLFSAVEEMEKQNVPQHVTVGSDVRFFGEPKHDPLALIDLVVIMNDPYKELEALNSIMKKAMHNANVDYYQTKNSRALYSVTKSEQYPYLPHLSLGHLRVNYIKEKMANKDKADQVIERIKQRIVALIKQELDNVLAEDKKVIFSTLNVYDTQSRTYIKEVTLKQK